MKKLIIVGVAIVIGIASIVTWYLISLERSRSIAQTREISPWVSSQSWTTDSWSTVKSWVFTRVDSIHYASGSATVVPKGDGYDIMLSDDFSTPSAPDLYVWISKQTDFSRGLDKNIAYLDLGPLRQNTGGSVFHISESELDRYGWSIVIWCKAFSIHFSHAILN